MSTMMKNTHRRRIPLALKVLVIGVTLMMASPAMAQDDSHDGHDHAHNGGWLDGTPRASLIATLSRYHQPPTLEELELLELDEDLDAALMDVAGDDSLVELPRKRAITLLAHYPADNTLQFVEQLLVQEDNLSILGRTTLLIGELGQTYPEWAVEHLEGLAQHDDFVIREMTVESLGVIRTQPAVNARVDETLMQLVIAERNPSVKTALQRVLDENPVLEPVQGDLKLQRLEVQPVSP